MKKDILVKFVRKIVSEQFENNNSETVIAYHGTSSLFPFQTFNPRSIGSGIVSGGGQKYGGFFFTTEKGNAEYYTEWFVAKVKINNVKQNPTDINHPPKVLDQAIKNNEIYKIDDIFDGGEYSDIIVVPISEINNIEIIYWEFVGEKEFYFESLDNFFGGDFEEGELDDDGIQMERYIDQNMIRSFIKMTGGGFDYLLTIPIFKEYYDSKY